MVGPGVVRRRSFDVVCQRQVKQQRTNDLGGTICLETHSQLIYIEQNICI